MARNSAIMAVVIAATVASVFLLPISDVVAQNTGVQSVKNETVVADDSFEDLRGYNVQQGSVSVNDSQGNSISSANWTVRYDTGEIKINTSDPAVSNGESMDVSYDYRAANESTTTVAGVVPILVALVVLVTLTSKVQEMM